MPDRNQSKYWPILIVFLMFVAIIFLVDAQAADEGNTNKPIDPFWIISTISLLFVIIGGGLGYMFVLQNRFLKVCEKNEQLSVFFQNPAGLPPGTVRAIIALIIVTISLYLAVLLFFKVTGPQTEFPQVLSGLLDAVIGFYFGTRSAAPINSSEHADRFIKWFNECFIMFKNDDLNPNVSFYRLQQT